MIKKIKIAVVGVGRWGVHLLRNFLEHPQASVVAVVDPNPECLAAVKRQHNLGNEILLTTEWQAIQQVEGLEAVVIATPASTHYSLITDALHWGYHVLAEKPLTLNPAECRELCQLAQKQQRQLIVDHTYLFHPAVTRGKAVVQARQLGDLRYGYATRTHLGPVRQDVDALWDLAIHDIAIFNSWLNQIPVKVQATGTVWLQPSVGGVGGAEEQRSRGAGGAGEAGEDKEITSPSLPHSLPPSLQNQGLSDLVWVTLTYPNNFQAYIHLCWLNPDKQRRLGVVGNLGSLIFDEMSRTSPLTILHGEFEQQENRFVPVNQKQQVLEIETGEPLGRVCNHFITCVLENSPSKVSSGLVGTQLVQILAALTESLNNGGKPVFLNANED
ncbi:Gfo/Idh/MocA family protein [Brasilonema bromeliae]|uniref:Gfo/Idh/MocA family oxidoreductase n=1 Tax=Brasilonema bromeliae SPC951 TaxID=385972 RepID=A0ABX1P3I1_9CYAN|nr:Gfo/Idh/MocA family oxidoreductase [Brasilonema bromeliae]NMG18867.1 gfo/Idh/MocA family oxidoreductase [Brasilonema bromeliae SPC951]